MTHEPNEWVFEEGRTAYLEGRSLSSNPYQRSVPSWQDWLNGWEFQQANPSSDVADDPDEEDDTDRQDFDDEADYPDDTPTLQSADLWGTGEGRHHGII
jgi:ribosome modulation factor